MIAKGTKLTLRPNRTYKDAPLRNVDVEVGTSKEFGNYQQCQVMDVTNTKNGKKTGFFYCRLHTDLPLAVNDVVTVKEILYVQRKSNICVFGIKIEEHSPNSLELVDEASEEYGF